MHLLRMSIPACLLVFLLCIGFTTSASAQEPDFSDTPDILHGQSHLLRMDDIVIADVKEATSAPYTNVLDTRFLLTANNRISKEQQITTQSTTPGPVNAGVQLAVGRMFDLPNDIVAVLAIDGGAEPSQEFHLALNLYDALGNRSLRQSIAVSATSANAPQSAVMADFTGDGFDDLALSFGKTAGQIVIIQAADVTNWDAGVLVGPAFVSDKVFLALAAASVDGKRPLHLVAVTAGSAPSGEGAEMVVLSIDPVTLQLSQQASTPLAGVTQVADIVGGNYDENPTDDEIVVVTAGAAIDSTVASLYAFGGNPLSATLLNTATVPSVLPVDKIDAASGIVHPLSNDVNTIVVDAEHLGAAAVMTVFTIEHDRFVQHTSLEYSDFRDTSIVLAHFNQAVAGGAADLDLKLAIYGAGVDSNSAELDVYEFGSNGSGYALNPLWSYSGALPIAFSSLQMAAGDLQGHSLRLGAPYKITVDHYSAPSTTVGMPPMHMDWVVPSCADPNYPGNCSTPQVVNVLTKPASTYAQLNTDVKNSTQSSSQKTTSFSLATQEDVDAKLSYGIPDLASVSAEIKDTARQTFDQSVATKDNSYASVAFDASVRTGFADHIWFDSYRFNIWTYPVIGRTACPAGSPNCAASEQKPLNVQFSGPDQINRYDLDGNVVEWYQPVWEPGNILSYPWTEGQLTTLLPRSTVVNKSDVWAADSSGSDASVTWAQGSGESQSQGNTTTYSNDASVTVASNASIEGFGFQGSAGFDITTSSSTQTLNTSSNSHGSSTGFTVAKTAQGVADYVFAAQTYILGQAPVSGTLQTVPVTSTVQISGPLRLAFWANPFDSTVGGAWWPTTYSLPDVALNHPQRWTWTSTPDAPNKMTFNAAMTTTSPFDQEFYYMRGLYITAQDAPNGSQLTMGPVTQTLLLQARVYNYSHVDMNAPFLAQKAAKVKVRFYGQLFRSDTGDYPVGDSFLIGERELEPIPGFASATTPGDVPNWSLAVQPFNPTSFAQTSDGNVYVRFWVVVWMEDAAGNLVPEMAGHGLTASPAAAPFNTLGDVQVEPYSNNVGTFKQVYYVQAANPQPEQSMSAGVPPTFTVTTSLTVLPTPTLPGRRQMTVTLRSGSNTLSPLQLAFYDGDPAQGGRLFDWELVPYVASGATFVNRVSYTPLACGVHTLYVVARTPNGEFVNSTRVEDTPCYVILPWVAK